METTPAEPTAAPDVLLTRLDDSKVALGSLWREGPLLLYFMRHLGCALCRAHLRQLVEAYPQFQQRGLQVSAITFADPVSTNFVRQTQLVPFAMYYDMPRAVYQAFGMYEGTFGDVLNLNVLAKQLQLIPKGFIPSIGLRANIRQLGGSVVIDRAGVIRLHHLAHPIDRYPTTDQYLTALG